MSRVRTARLVLIVATFLSIVALDVPLARWCAVHVMPNYSGLVQRLSRFGAWQMWWQALAACTAGCIVVAVLQREAHRRNAWLRRARLSGLTLANVVISGLLVVLLKWVIGRTRPELELGVAAHGPLEFHPFYLPWDDTHMSMPSGHAQVAWSLVAPMMLFYPQTRVPCVVGAVLVSLTRVLLVLHYFSDVLVGAYLGFMAMFYVLPLFERVFGIIERRPRATTTNPL